MSADNWAQCPKCAQKRTDLAIEAERELHESYGVIPADKWMQLRADLEAIKAREPDASFREDYEIYGAEDGVVTVSYSGACMVCDLNIKFKEEHPLWPTK